MTDDSKTIPADLSALKIIHYPDPRLAQICSQIEQIDQKIRMLADRMFELMFEANGVGLAAPQVGITLQLFVASPTLQTDDREIFINPKITSTEDTVEVEEGCLSLPGINCNIKRAKIVTVEALDAYGKPFSVTADELAARAYQHEIDHLNGRIILDRMGSLSKLANRRTIKDLQDQFAG